jgi:hypothetical protein
MNKLPLILIFISFLNAAQFSGLLIDEASGRGLDAKLWINGQETPLAADGRYEAEIENRQPNHYLVRTRDSGNYLFISDREDFNLQLRTGRPGARGTYSRSVDIDLILLDSGERVEEADVFIYTVRPEIKKTYIAGNTVRAYNRGRAQFRYLQAAEVMHALVSRNGELYVQRLENIVPGKMHSQTLELSEFRQMDGLSGVGYEDSEGFWQKMTVPEAAGYYLAPNARPVFSKGDQDGVMFYFGADPEFPADPDYYNLWELIYYSGAEGWLTVYTDWGKDGVDLSGYGQYELAAAKGYHVNGVELGNFSLGQLKSAREMYEWTGGAGESGTDDEED